MDIVLMKILFITIKKIVNYVSLMSDSKEFWQSNPKMELRNM